MKDKPLDGEHRNASVVNDIGVDATVLFLCSLYVSFHASL